MKVFNAKRYVVEGEYAGIEDYLRNEFGLRDQVSLKGMNDSGMHGNKEIIWSTPDGEIKCRAYYRMVMFLQLRCL
jgi:hypothetical protein